MDCVNQKTTNDILFTIFEVRRSAPLVKDMRCHWKTTDVFPKKIHVEIDAPTPVMLDIQAY